MKKIININLSGRVIPIEDSAYEKLQAYIESLRRYFSKEESRDEIINDIESRIAELMNEKVRKGATAITDADVEEIAASMGRPEDFDAEEAAETITSSSSANQQQQYTYNEKKAKGRLYRDTSDKFIGGVCSGIAAYLNVDPAIVRILFAIITFGGFGLGFVAYILLWIILPPKDLESFGGKRLFRNPDDRIIGGVAGGLAAYFNRSTSTIRLIFAAPLILNILISFLDGISVGDGFHFFPNLVIGSLSGTFILAYVVLWMVLPEARSPYEKMEMRGEKVDVNTIRQNVKEGVDTMKERVKNWTEEVKETAENIGNKAKEYTKEYKNTRGKAFAADVKETTRRTGSGIGHAIGVLFKVFFLFIAGTVAFSIFVALLALLFGGIAWWPINNFLWTSKWQQLYAWGTLIFFCIVPLVGFIIWVVRRILRVRSHNNYLGYTFSFLWVLGWVSAILLTASLVKDHRDQEFSQSTIGITQPANGRMIVTVSEPALSYTGRFDWLNDGEESGWDLSNDTMKLSMVDFEFDKSIDNDYHVIMRRYSHGKNRDEALARAEKIQYRVTSQDSILDLANGYAIDKDSKFRWQYVEIEIQIPAGKKIRFDRSVNNKLEWGRFSVGDDKRRRRGINNDRYDYYTDYHLRSDVDYVMGDDRVLRDAKGDPAHRIHYRYNAGSNDGISNDSSDIDELKEQQRKGKEAEERLKKIEEQKKTDSTKPVGSNNESMDNKDERTTSIIRSPIHSLVQWF